MTPARYRTIVADPPWPFRWSGSAGGAHRNPTPMAYRLMPLEEIKALPISDLAADDAHLFMWVTPELHRLGEGVATARAWGFEPVDEIIWEKPNIGMGVFPRHVHEPLLIARRGNLPFTGPRNIRSVQKWSQRHAGNGGGKVHSAKPDAALDLIEQVSPGPYLELFARRARFGWDYWGDESLGTAKLTPTSEAVA
jgi:N6-adenosine-specific RNA methylase IME4